MVGSLICNTKEVSGQCGGSVKIIKIRSNFCSTIKIHPDFIAYLIKHKIHLIKKQCIDKLGHWIIGQTWLLPKIAFCTFSDFFWYLSKSLFQKPKGITNQKCIFTVQIGHSESKNIVQEAIANWASFLTQTLESHKVCVTPVDRVNCGPCSCN